MIRIRSRAVVAMRGAVLVIVLLGPPELAAQELCGDTDQDGLYETEDIQQCLDALSGPGPHIVRLVENQVFQPFFDTPPFYNPIGFVELASDTTLDCQGSAIRGIDDVAKRAPKAWGALWVVTNSDHRSDSQSDIWVRNCEIDGGMPESYDEAANPFDEDKYMGFALYGVTRGGIVDSHVHDTHHACVYIRNSQDIDVDDNLLEACGAFHDQGTFRQPAVYLFQAGTTPQQRINVRRNRAHGAGWALYNTRISENNSEFQTGWMRDILFEDNFGDQFGEPDPCFSLRGVHGIVVRGNTCGNTSGIVTSPHNKGYCADNPSSPVDRVAESSCLVDVLIEDNLLIDTRASGAGSALTIYDYHTHVIVRDNRIFGTEAIAGLPISCVRWQTPLRHFEIEGLCAMDCAAAGVEQDPLSADQLNVPSDEYVVLRELVVHSSGAEGLILRKRLEGLTLDRLAVRESTGAPLVVLGSLLFPALTEIYFGSPLPGWAAGVCAQDVAAFPSGSALQATLLIALVAAVIRRLDRVARG